MKEALKCALYEEVAEQLALALEPEWQKALRVDSWLRARATFAPALH